MIFKSIYLKEGMFTRTIDFSPNANLIHSNNNSRGKTTLIRLMLYGLGYAIPNTRKIKFDHCSVEIELESETSGIMHIRRNDINSIEVELTSGIRTFILPEQQHEFHALIWGTENPDILNNLLGAYYVDQEKGWTLLNRGIVIGSIHFNINELIRGLSGVDCSVLIEKEARISKEIGKYEQLYSVAQYREALANDGTTLIPYSYSEEIDTTIDSLLIEQRQLKSELTRIDQTLSNNKHFKNLVADLKLIVRSPNGTIFPVTDQNIVGLNDSIDILVSKRKILSMQLSQLSSRITDLQRKKIAENEQLSFLENASQIEVFDRSISRMPIDQIIIDKEMKRLKDERRRIKEEIDQITSLHNTVASIISENIIKYATELGIGDKDSIPVSYLFTHNLKELSGAILHKTAFAFRLAYIIAIESVINTKLPIILDSPSGKEIDLENVKLMMELLKRDFSDHQIIISSIYTYDFPELKTIEIINRLIE